MLVLIYQPPCTSCMDKQKPTCTFEIIMLWLVFFCVCVCVSKICNSSLQMKKYITTTTVFYPIHHSIVSRCTACRSFCPRCFLCSDLLVMTPQRDETNIVCNDNRKCTEWSPPSLWHLSQPAERHVWHISFFSSLIFITSLAACCSFYFSPLLHSFFSLTKKGSRLELLYPTKDKIICRMWRMFPWSLRWGERTLW